MKHQIESLASQAKYNPKFQYGLNKAEECFNSDPVCVFQPLTEQPTRPAKDYDSLVELSHRKIHNLPSKD